MGSKTAKNAQNRLRSIFLLIFGFLEIIWDFNGFLLKRKKWGFPKWCPNLCVFFNCSYFIFFVYSSVMVYKKIRSNKNTANRILETKARTLTKLKTNARKLTKARKDVLKQTKTMNASKFSNLVLGRWFPTNNPLHSRIFGSRSFLNYVNNFSEMAKPTLTVKKFAGNQRIKNINDIEKIVFEKVNEISNIALPQKLLEKEYCKRSAEKIIKDEYVATGKFVGKKGRKYRVGGCVDRALLTCALLRARNIPSLFMRLQSRSFTIFYFKGKWFSIEGVSTSVQSLSEQDLLRYKRISSGKRPRLGIDVDNKGKNLGMKDIYSFERFI